MISHQGRYITIAPGVPVIEIFRCLLILLNSKDLTAHGMIPLSTSEVHLNQIFPNEPRADYNFDDDSVGITRDGVSEFQLPRQYY